MVLGALDDAGGQEYLATQATKNPAAFLALLGRVLPTMLASDPVHPVKYVFEWAHEDLPSKPKTD